MEKSSFFNSVNGDRKYKASDFAEYFNSLLTNGVFPNPSTNLQVIANSNMTVTLKAGKAWINGYFYYNTDDLILSIDVADGVLNRIDRIVLKMDTINRNITAVVKKGTFASSPVAQTLQQDADAYELGIADVYVGHGVTSISQVNITDLRMNTTLCGWVNSLIQADTTAIFNQYLDWYTQKTGEYQADIDNMEAQFQNDWNTWFSTVQSALDGDTAGNLLNQINNLAGAGRTTETVKGNADAIARHEADYMQHGINGVTTDVSGTNTAYTLTLNPALSAYNVGLRATLFFDKTNGGALTLNISGKGAIGWKKQDGSDYAAGEILINTPYTGIYNGTSFLADSSSEIKIAGQTEITATFAGAISKNDPVYLTGVYNQDTSTKMPAIGGPQLGRVEGLSFTTDGLYMAVSFISSPYIALYKISNDDFISLPNPATLPTGLCMDVAFSTDGVYLALAVNVSPFVTIYKKNGDTLTKLANPATLPAGYGNGVAFSPDGVYLAVSHETSPFLTIYKRSGDTFTKLTDPTTLPSGSGNGVAFSPDGVYLAVATSNTPYLTIYKRSGDTFTKLANPATLPAGLGYSVAFSPDGVYLVVGHSTTPFITIYKRNGDVFTKLANPSNLISGNGANMVSFSSDSKYLSIAHDLSPFATIYSRTDDVFTKLSGLNSNPTSGAYSVAFSPDLSRFVVGLAYSPYIVVYKGNLQSLKATKSANNFSELSSALGAGYAKESGVLNDNKKVIKLWG